MLRISLAIVLVSAISANADPKDWPTYNQDPLGHRHNSAETALGPNSIARLEEKWRFPPRDSKDTIGVVHGTPIVVDGYVYFATTTKPAVYKLAPNGTLRWSYKLPERAESRVTKDADGVIGSVLVTDDGVYFGDLRGYLYGLDRKSGKEKWRIDTREKPFPDAHIMNASFASPIVTDGKIVFAGGAFEQWFAVDPKYRGCTGRGYVLAVDPQSGKIAWKYDVGPKPQPLDPPMRIKDSWGEQVFYFGPASSTIWCTPSYDAETKTVYFGTDSNTAPRQPTKDDPRLDTPHACAAIALDARDGKQKWVTQISPGDIWLRTRRAYDPKTGRYLDQSIGDTPKVYSIGEMRVVGFGCKNGGFYVLNASDGKIIEHTPLYTGKPTYPLDPPLDARVLALPGPLGGLQTGCATDGKNIFTNGLDGIQLGTQESSSASSPPTAGRVTSIVGDTKTERWRHERPKTSPAGAALKAVHKEVGDPIASGLAVANGVVYFTTTVSQKLVALDASSGSVLKEIDVGPVWSGPSVSRGRVYVGTGNTLFSGEGAAGTFSVFPYRATGTLISFGLPGEDEVAKMGSGKE